MTNFFSDLLSSITDKGRKLVDIGKNEVGLRETDPVKISHTLLSEKGEASGTALAADLFSSYENLEVEKKNAFFIALAKDFGPDLEILDEAIKEYQAGPGQISAMALHGAAESRRQELIRRLNKGPNGTRNLVKIREDLLRVIKDNPDLKSVDHDFEHLLSSWFNRGFLMLERISWQTPANILEKIIRYEAVHEIQSWEDLRRRIDPPDRRCYAFFHPALIDEPLIFVEVALSSGIPQAIEPILEEGRAPLSGSEADTAVFYSISNCQKGLKGISFGSFLIKQVVQTLLQDLPHLKTFVTLSPVPTFIKWLDMELQKDSSEYITEDQKPLLKSLKKKGWKAEGEAGTQAHTLLSGLAASYFMHGKDRHGNPFDPVARFHLGNGARLEQINWPGDRSIKAQKQAASLMVNYLYKLGDIEKNHEAYAKQNKIVASKKVRGLAKELPLTDLAVS